jgi:transposase
MDKNRTLFIGMDLGDRWSRLTILDPAEGQVVEESRVPTSGGAMQRKFSALAPARVAMEVGTHSRWVSQALRDLGHEVLVANARKLRVILDNPRKGDRADSHTLARLARLDPKLLFPIEHRSPQAQADLDDGP